VIVELFIKCITFSYVLSAVIMYWKGSFLLRLYKKSFLIYVVLNKNFSVMNKQFCIFQ